LNNGKRERNCARKQSKNKQQQAAKKYVEWAFYRCKILMLLNTNYQLKCSGYL
jgi:hypothetical protein